MRKQLEIADRVPRTRSPWDSWYASRRWIKIAKHQLRAEPFCRLCKARGNPASPASIADHVTPHYGDQALFWFGPLQSLCKPCHDGEKRLIESRGYSDRIGPDGYPIDPMHPFYTGLPP